MKLWIIILWCGFASVYSEENTTTNLPTVADTTTEDSLADIESETERYQVLLAKSAALEPLEDEEEKEPFSKKSICLTRQCVSAASRIFDYMNEEADPCEDFNEFACGRFISSKAIPEDKSEINVFTVIQNQVEQRGQNLLETPNDDKLDFESYKMAKTYYKSCMDQETLEDLGNKPGLDILKELGGWPVLEDDWESSNFDVWDQALKSSKLGFSSNLIASTFSFVDAKNASVRVLYIDQASLGLDKENFEKGLDSSPVQAYHKYMVDTAIYFGAADNDKTSQDMLNALKFEQRLAEISSSKAERRNKTLLYNPTTLGELPSGSPLPESWSEYVQTLFTQNDPNSKIQVDDSEKVIVYDRAFYGSLGKVLSEFDEETKANYMLWRVASGTLSYLDKKARDISQAFKKATTGQESIPPDWKRCAKNVGFNSYGSNSFQYAVSSMYAKKYFPQEGKADVIEMTRYLRKAFAQILSDIDWMDPETKVEAKAKLDKMGQFIAYPDEILDQEKIDGIYKDLVIKENDYIGNTLRVANHMGVFSNRRFREPVDPSDWRDNHLVALVNAFYKPSVNYFQFPAGILQGSFYDYHVPKYLNYGGIGFVMGHEITHGFDDQGRQRNSVGELDDWWKPETNEKFKEKAQCIIWQYGNYTVKQINQTLNGVNTQGENIADNGGLKEAYIAYQNWENDHGVEPGLPGLPYSSKQLFWIASAQNWCAKYKDVQLEQRVLTGYHSPGEFRINGPLSNNPDFAKDFNCPAGSKMNPVKKCQVW